MDSELRSETQKIDSNIDAKCDVTFIKCFFDFGRHFGSMSEPLLLIFCVRCLLRFLLASVTGKKGQCIDHMGTVWGRPGGLCGAGGDSDGVSLAEVRHALLH